MPVQAKQCSSAAIAGCLPAARWLELNMAGLSRAWQCDAAAKQACKDSSCVDRADTAISGRGTFDQRCMHDRRTARTSRSWTLMECPSAHAACGIPAPCELSGLLLLAATACCRLAAACPAPSHCPPASPTRPAGKRVRPLRSSAATRPYKRARPLVSRHSSFGRADHNFLRGGAGTPQHTLDFRVNLRGCTRLTGAE